MKTMSTLMLPGMLLALSSPAGAQEPLVLDDLQLDAVTAGLQYSTVYGQAYAEEGTVSIVAKAGTRTNSIGLNSTKAVLKLDASGSGLIGMAGGESAVGEEYSGVYAEAYSPEGTLKITVKTMSKLTPGGIDMTKSMVKVKASGSGAEVYSTRF